MDLFGSRVLVLCWILIKLHPQKPALRSWKVLVLCWILIKLHHAESQHPSGEVLVLCWILIKLHRGARAARKPKTDTEKPKEWLGGWRIAAFYVAFQNEKSIRSERPSQHGRSDLTIFCRINRGKVSKKAGDPTIPYLLLYVVLFCCLCRVSAVLSLGSSSLRRALFCKPPYRLGICMLTRPTFKRGFGRSAFSYREPIFMRGNSRIGLKDAIECSLCLKAR